MKQEKRTLDYRQQALINAADGILIDGKSIIDLLEEVSDFAGAVGCIAENTGLEEAGYAKRLTLMSQNLLYGLTNYLKGEDPKEAEIDVSYRPA